MVMASTLRRGWRRSRTRAASSFPAKPVEVFAVDGIARSDAAPGLDQAKLIQEIKHCQVPDGVRLAYAIAGSGPTLVKAANWMNHLEYDWESPIWRHVFRGLARDHTLIRYDARGDLVAPIEAGRQLAAGISGAHFIALQGQNHLFLEQEPASERFFEEINFFLSH